MLKVAPNTILPFLSLANASSVGNIRLFHDGLGCLFMKAESVQNIQTSVQYTIPRVEYIMVTHR